MHDAIDLVQVVIAGQGGNPVFSGFPPLGE